MDTGISQGISTGNEGPSFLPPPLSPRFPAHRLYAEPRRIFIFKRKMLYCTGDDSRSCKRAFTRVTYDVPQVTTLRVYVYWPVLNHKGKREREMRVMHVRAIVCTVLYDGRALTTVARLHRMNIKYKRYRRRRGGCSFSASLLSRFPSSDRPCISSWAV